MRLDFEPAETFRGTRILRQRDGLAYAYVTSHAAADADGAPNAYHPADRGKPVGAPHVGLDSPANAGYGNTPRSWWSSVLAADPGDASRPYVQPSGPFKGFFVTMTALRVLNGDPLDPATYVDATKVPYVVIPSGFEELPNVAKQGDVGLATHLASGATTAFIVADHGGGSDAKLGEGSIALYDALGFPDANPRTGAGLPQDAIQYLLFPKSRRSGAARWPRTNDDVRTQVANLIASTPGVD